MPLTEKVEFKPAFRGAAKCEFENSSTAAKKFRQKLKVKFNWLIVWTHNLF
jgi:hypothetical protein